MFACVGYGKKLRRFRASCDVGCLKPRHLGHRHHHPTRPRPPEEEGGGAGHRRSPTPPLASTRRRCPAPAAPPAHACRLARPEVEENLHAIRRPPEKEEDPAPPANPVHAVRRARPRSEQKVGEREEEEKGNRRREEAKKRGGGGGPPWPLDAAPSVTLALSAASDVPPMSRYALPSLHGVQCW